MYIPNILFRNLYKRLVSDAIWLVFHYVQASTTWISLNKTFSKFLFYFQKERFLLIGSIVKRLLHYVSLVPSPKVESSSCEDVIHWLPLFLLSRVLYTSSCLRLSYVYSFYAGLTSSFYFRASNWHQVKAQICSRGATSTSGLTCKMAF